MRIISFTFLILFSLFIELSASPKISFEDLMANAERNNGLRNEAVALALMQKLPVTILTSGGLVIDAKGVESGKVVYAVIKDFANIFNGGFAAFYEDVISSVDIGNSKIVNADGTVVDNSAGKFTYEVSGRSGTEEYLMVTDWTFDRVYLFKKQNGDLVDTAFIHSAPTVLTSPKMAMQHFNGKNILISDQITDGVFRFDTSGVYIGLFAPSSGINNAILDNIRGIRYRSNNNLLVNVASGASQNTVQQFDTGGVHIGTFIGNTNLNSPFDILIRSNDMLISNSSGTNRITRFDLNGNFLSNFYSGASFNFPQQLQRLPNGNVIVAAFSNPSGIAMLDSNGNFLRLLTGTTGLRSVYLLDNGHYLVTNSAGVHEVDTSNGAVIRTVVTGANYQYITPYSPGMVVSVGNNNTGLINYFELSQNFPNPFNPSTVIRYSLSENSFVKLKVYDVLGNEVAVLVNENQNRGSYIYQFSTANYPLSSGIYYYSIEAGDFKQTKKMMLIK